MDVFQVVKALRTQKPGAVPALVSHYKNAHLPVRNPCMFISCILTLVAFVCFTLLQQHYQMIHRMLLQYSKETSASKY